MKLNNKEPMEVYAVVYGYLAKTHAKVQTAPFNKIVVELGFDRLGVGDLQQVAKQLASDEHLTNIVECTMAGEFTLKDLQHYDTGKEVYPDGNPYRTVTPYIVEHQRALKNSREYNKALRDGAYLHILVDDMQKELADSYKHIKLNTAEAIQHNPDPKENTLIIFISDWHIGATTSTAFDHGGYNYKILKERLATLLSEAKETANLYAVEEVVCMFVGDMIEGADMRGGQKWGLEFTLAEQVAKGTEALANFLSSLETIAPVRFGAIRGNHDRLTGQANKKDSIYNDSAMYVILDNLKTFERLGGLPNTEIITTNIEDMYDLQFKVYGRRYHINHGDMLKGNGSQFANFMKDHPIDYLITGHVHHYRTLQDHRDRIHFTVGSPMGYNTYSKELNLGDTAPNQLMLVARKGKSPVVLPVFL